ncbi:MAG: hypothetical protein U0V74_06155 [Chitinophagales bacterium]
MKKLGVNLLLITLLVAIFNLEVQAGQATIAGGTMVTVSVKSDWNSNQGGEPPLMVAAPVTDINGNVLIAAGAPVFTQSQTKRVRSVGRMGTLNTVFLGVQAVDGQNIALSGITNKEGRDRKGLVHGLTWPFFFFVMGPLALSLLAIKGKPVKLQAGEMFGMATIAGTRNIRIPD